MVVAEAVTCGEDVIVLNSISDIFEANVHCVLDTRSSLCKELFDLGTFMDNCGILLLVPDKYEDMKI